MLNHKHTHMHVCLWRKKMEKHSPNYYEHVTIPNDSWIFLAGFICFVSARAISYIIDGKIIVRGDETFPLKLWAIFYMRNNNFATKRVNKVIISHQTIPIPNWLIQKQNSLRRNQPNGLKTLKPNWAIKRWINTKLISISFFNKIRLSIWWD